MPFHLRIEVYLLDYKIMLIIDSISEFSYFMTDNYYIAKHVELKRFPIIYSNRIMVNTTLLRTMVFKMILLTWNPTEAALSAASLRLMMAQLWTWLVLMSASWSRFCNWFIFTIS